MRDLRRYWPPLLAGHPDIVDRLVKAYDGQGRRYHDTRHLLEVFDRIDVLLGSDIGSGIDRDGVLLAAWFHDAVYDTTGHNEERSATLARRELATADAPPMLIEEVARLVRLTASHESSADDRAGQVLCDADLGILAADAERYEEYATAVREEYADIPDNDFRAGRAGILRRLLDKPTLFQTSFAKQHWEQPARRNIEGELADLEGEHP